MSHNSHSFRVWFGLAPSRRFPSTGTFFAASCSSCSTDSKPESTDDVPENVGDGVRLPPDSGSVSGEDDDIVIREFIQKTFFDHDVFGSGLLTKVQGGFLQMSKQNKEAIVSLKIYVTNFF